MADTEKKDRCCLFIVLRAVGQQMELVGAQFNTKGADSLPIGRAQMYVVGTKFFFFSWYLLVPTARSRHLKQLYPQADKKVEKCR